jgi:hypothetical protein
MNYIKKAYISIATMLAAVPVLNAQFVGEINIPTPPATYTTNQTLGAWSTAFVTIGSLGINPAISTAGSPINTVTLNTGTPSGNAQSSTASLTHTFTAAGVFSFTADMVFDIAIGGTSIVSWQLNTNPSISYTASQGINNVSDSFVVAIGDIFKFTTFAQGGSVLGSSTAETELVISEAEFAPIPEPASIAVLTGMAGLVAVNIRRRKHAR